MSELISASHVFTDCPATCIDEVLGFFSQKAVELGCADSVSTVFDAFRAREAQGTTGMAGGFAIPHAKSPAVKELVVLAAKFSGQIEWPSMDDAPIKFAIALLVPSDQAGTTYLQLLSKIAVMLMDSFAREELLAENDPAKLAELIDAGINKG